MIRRVPLILALVVASSLACGAQQPDAIVKFQFFWKALRPQSYTITIHRSGQAEYVSEDHALSPPQEQNAPVESNAEQASQLNEAASKEVMRKQFKATDALRQKVFALAERSHFFDGQFEFTKHAVAHTGQKTLSYADPGHHASTTYNYSENPAIQELTDVFQAISSTIEFGERLEYDRRFDKLSLDRDMKSLDELSSSGHLEEVQVIAPLLRRLATDRTVLHIAQLRAERILRKAGLETRSSNPQ
jgi:hypothetical protein